VTLQSQLITLEASGLIRLAETQPELEYLFRHALVQEAAYASLVKTDRRQLHLAVGEALERLYPDRLDARELAPLLADHFFKAGDDERALKYFTLAGDAAARVYANAEAALHYSRALEIAKRALAVGHPPSAIPPSAISHLYLSLGQVLELSARYEEAMRAYAEMEAAAQTRGDQAMAFDALMARAKVYATPNPAYDPAQARVLLEKALTLVHKRGDRAAEAQVLWNLMVLNIFAGGDLRQAIQYGERAIALARELGLRERLAFTLNDIHYAYLSLAEPERAWAALHEARELWRELGNLPMLADSTSNTAFEHYCRGQYDLALAASDEAFHIAHSINNAFGQATSRFMVGPIHADRGEIDKAIAVMEEDIGYGEKIGHPGAAIIAYADLGWLYGTLGLVERGLELVRRAVENAGRIYPLWQPGAMAALARLHLRNGDLAAAAPLVQDSVRDLKVESIQLFSNIWVALAEGELALARQEYARAVTLMDEVLGYIHRAIRRPFIPEVLFVKGKALRALNQMDAASEVLNAARAEAEALGSRRNLWPILAALSELEAERGHAAAAASLRQRAAGLITFVADHIGDAELRATFVALPRVRAVLHYGS
jgi:tetratricopeptide (TPR) repeat protein